MGALAPAAAASRSTPGLSTSLQTRVVQSFPLPIAPDESEGPAPYSGPADNCRETPRSTLDRPDITKGPMIHVIYLLGADSPDQQLDTNGTLDCALEGQNRWLEDQIGKRWRMDQFELKVDTARGVKTVRALDVTFVRSSQPAAELGGATDIRDELIKLGFARTGKRYLTYVMAQYTTYCGDAIYPISLHPGERRDGVYAQVYLSSTNSCHAQHFGTRTKPSWSDAIAEQELLHTEGLAPIGAPHSCPVVLPFAHVCTAGLYYTEESVELDPERVDLMFPYISLPLSEKVIDRGNDDYFNHPFPFADLADSPYLID